MKTVYLINNKDDEPNFPSEFAQGLQKHAYTLKELSISDLSFYITRKSMGIEFYEGEKELTLDSSDRFFIRTRKVFASPTALLAFALSAADIPFNELHEGLSHTLRGSKIAQPFICKKSGVHFPDSFITVVSNAEKVIPLVEEKIGYPMVIKQSGRRGEKVWKCTDKASVSTLMETLRKDDQEKNIVFQEYIKNEFDIRIIVHYGEIIAAVARSAADGFLNNVSQGGSARAIELTEEEMDIARTVTKVLELDLTGIDLVRTADGPLLFEVNKSPDITCFSQAAGYSIPERLADDFIKHTS